MSENRIKTGWPVVTLMMAAAALLIQFSGNAAWVLVFDRASILHGEVWRLWTGNVVHFRVNHLLWNLAVFVPAGIWIERLEPRQARTLLIGTPLLIGLAVLLLDPSLQRYAGLSGAASGLLVLLALRQLEGGGSARWIWWTVLLLVVVKVTVELVGERAIFAQFDDMAIRVVPLAHVVGILAAVAIHFIRRRK
jgi:rhomboid family GlyGly-CTERM serine protease